MSSDVQRDQPRPVDPGPTGTPLPAGSDRTGLVDPCAERELVAGLLRDRTEGPELDVFLAGTVFMDMIFTGLRCLPPPGTELYASGLGSAPGGIANLAVAMSRLGLKVGLAAVFGDDMFGTYLWRTLAEQEGVDLSASRRCQRWPSPVTVSLAVDGDRGMVSYQQPLPQPVDGPADLVTAAPAAKTCLIHLEGGVPRWARQARAAGAAVFAEVGWDPAEKWCPSVLESLADVDVFLPNAVEAMAYTRTDSPEAALRALAERVETVVVKLGGEGAIGLDSDGRIVREPALPVRALDPTGAGDVFAAAFLFGTLAKWPLSQRIRFANLTAGLSVRHYSGSLGAPCWGEIAAFGESSGLPDEVLAPYGFVVDYIPQSTAVQMPRAEPTVGYGRSFE